MTYDNYIALYEAVYLYERVKEHGTFNLSTCCKLGFHEHVYHAIKRILNHFDFNIENAGYNHEQYNHTVEIVNSLAIEKNFNALFDKARSKDHFFFNQISAFEYEIYSLSDFETTYKIGEDLIQRIDFTDRNVLELGGNSGGLGTAIQSKYNTGSYTIVDMEIPCKVGNALKHENNSNIDFVVGNIFNLDINSATNDLVIMMNLLHDFDDDDCCKIIKNCENYIDAETRFLIVEDILQEGNDNVLHGLRLAIECRGGKQRSVEDFNLLFTRMGYCHERTVQIDAVHTLIAYKKR